MGNGQAGIEYCFKGNYQARDFQSVFALVVDWRKPDAQINAELRKEVVAKRPEQFAAMAKGSPKQSAFFEQLGRLPFRPSNALDWLGVWRRRRKAATWAQYWRLYHKGTEYFRGAETAREADCRKVEIILAWLETGKPLDPSKFA